MLVGGPNDGPRQVNRQSPQRGGSVHRVAVNRVQAVPQQPVQHQPVQYQKPIYPPQPQSEETYYQEVPQELPEEPPRKSTKSKSKVKTHTKKIKWLKVLLVTVNVLAILAVAGWIAWTTWFTKPAVMAEIDTSKNQAVFFDNGQFYFGKLEIINDQYMKMSDVFYVQEGVSEADADKSPNDRKDPDEAVEGGMKLIKLGDEVHGPEDNLVINRDQVLFFENLKPDGKVSQLIQQYKTRGN